MTKDTVIIFHPRAFPGNIVSVIPYEFLHLERMVRGKVRLIFIDEHLDTDYLSILNDNRYRLLLAGLGSMTGYQLLGGINFSKAIKALGDISVVWGGWHPSLLPEQVLREEYVDYVICGQGEIAFSRLVENLLNGLDAYDIPNLGYKLDGRMHINPREKIHNPNEFPPIDFNIIDANRYVMPKRFSDRSIVYFATTGCPNACGFCSMVNVYGKGWWHKGVDEIVKHLVYLKEKTNMGAVRFPDPTFFVNREFVLELCRKIIDAKLDLHFQANAQAARFNRMFSDEDIALIVKAGFKRIFIGAESGDPEVLEKINKQSTVTDNIESVRKLKNHNTTPVFGIMVCFPWNPEKDYRNTIKMVMKAKLINPRLEVFLNAFHPFPGTPMFDEAIKYGFVPPENMNEWIVHIQKKFFAPWSKRNYLIPLRIVKKIYFPFITPGVYRKLKGVKRLAFIFLLIFFRPIIWLRFRTGMVRFPVEGYFLYYSALAFHRITGLKWGLGKPRQSYQYVDI